MPLSTWILASAWCSIGPAALFCLNLRRFRSPRSTEETFSLSVLIPARNEAVNIRPALACVLASTGADLEVLVCDDGSTDGTAEIVHSIAEKDGRVRLISGQELPPGWNGKQHACWSLARQATRPVLVFLDADVRIEPGLLQRMAAFRVQSRAALVSGFPRLIVVTWLERMLLPLIHFVLLGFLPMGVMRRGTRPSFAAGCGQFLLIEREAYFAVGGHAAIRESMHDGLMLPRVLRHARYRTDIADITDLASVRMYDSATAVWQGLAKNATEGIATPGKIVPLSAILLLGQVAPILLACAWVLKLWQQGLGAEQQGDAPTMNFVLGAALLCAYLPRFLALRRFRQPLGSALLHPVGVLLLLAVQWYALARKLFGKPVGWRQRTYSSQTGAELG